VVGVRGWWGERGWMGGGWVGCVGGGEWGNHAFYDIHKQYWLMQRLTCEAS